MFIANDKTQHPVLREERGVAAYAAFSFMSVVARRQTLQRGVKTLEFINWN